MIRRLIVMAFGFVVAIGVGAIFLFVSALFDPATRELGFEAAIAGVFAFIDEGLREGDSETPFAAFGFVLWAIVVATCVAPLAVAALIGEIAGARTLVWYSGVSATLAGASPWIARAAKGLEPTREANPLESRIALLFFLTGAVTGAVYWLIAAPAAPERLDARPASRPLSDRTKSSD
ncbi:hypothetical protein V3H18_08270 [Methylocystis sp. 9N]|uniref:Uncharacterized protein n=1 Tax=Methylocystis borbori TaxID=3118750 RepID=A0ABU7XGL6_9HYPH